MELLNQLLLKVWSGLSLLSEFSLVYNRYVYLVIIVKKNFLKKLVTNHLSPEMSSQCRIFFTLKVPNYTIMK